MKFDHLNTFRQVAHTGSFTRAAQKLFVTQPTVTQHIQFLEKELNEQLFYRSKSDTRLTPAGRMLLKSVDAIFEILDDMKVSFQNYSEDVRGNLSIGATTVIGTHFLAPFIVEFLKQYKNVSFSLHYGNSYTISEWTQNGIIDFGFAPHAPGFTKLDFTFVHREKVRFAIGPGHSLAMKRTVSVGDLAGIPFFIREKGSRISDVVTRWLNAQAWPENPPLLAVCTDMDVLKKIVEMGAGITALPESALKREFSMGLLHEVILGNHPLYVDYYLVQMQNPGVSQAAASFIDLFRKMGGLKLDTLQRHENGVSQS